MSQAKLLLVVTNPNKLEKGSLPKCSFDVAGGSIGSHKDSHWRLLDYADSIVSICCEIRFVRGQFCIIDRCGEVFVNSAHQALGKDIVVALCPGDSLKIAEYQIRVEFFNGDLEFDIDSTIESMLGVGVSDFLEQPVSNNYLMVGGSENEEELLIEKHKLVSLDPLQLFNSETIDEPLEHMIPMTNLGISEQEVSGSDQSSTNVESVSFSKRAVDSVSTKNINSRNDYAK